MHACICLLSCVRLYATPGTLAHQPPLFMGFPMQEYWGGLSFPSPGDLPQPRDQTRVSCTAGGFFTTDCRFFFFNGFKVAK